VFCFSDGRGRDSGACGDSWGRSSTPLNSTQTTTTIKYERAIVRYTQKKANNRIKLSIFTRVLFCYISLFSTLFCRVWKSRVTGRVFDPNQRFIVSIRFEKPSRPYGKSSNIFFEADELPLFTGGIFKYADTQRTEILTHARPTKNVPPRIIS
jgi:hypothetical protein